MLDRRVKNVSTLHIHCYSCASWIADTSLSNKLSPTNPIENIGTRVWPKLAQICGKKRCAVPLWRMISQSCDNAHSNSHPHVCWLFNAYVTSCDTILIISIPAPQRSTIWLSLENYQIPGSGSHLIQFLSIYLPNLNVILFCAERVSVSITAYV